MVISEHQAVIRIPKQSTSRSQGCLVRILVIAERVWRKSLNLAPRLLRESQQILRSEPSNP